MDNYIVTIARGYGSGGKGIGDILGRKLKIPCYEDEILQMASLESGISEALFNEVDEKLRGGFMKKFIYNWAMGIEDDFKGISGFQLFQYQSSIIKKLADSTSCIIVGKCADYVLREYSNVVRVYIEAPRKECLNRLMNKYGWTAEEAANRIIKMDKQRSEYYKCYTGGREWTNPTNYDIILNSQTLKDNGCVSIIERCIQVKI